MKFLQISGTLLRNGPGLFEFRDQKADHAFDGMAMIRRYHVDKPQDVNQTSPDMNISRRLIQSDFLRDNLAAGGLFFEVLTIFFRSIRPNCITALRMTINT